MDWIERWFNIYPDNGDGSLELLVLAILFAVAAVLTISLSPSIRISMRKALSVIARWRLRERF